MCSGAFSFFHFLAFPEAISHHDVGSFNFLIDNFKALKDESIIAKIPLRFTKNYLPSRFDCHKKLVYSIQMKKIGLITALVLLSAEVLAQQQATVNLPSKSNNIKLPSHFNGFALELTQMNDFFGIDDKHRNPIFMQLLRNINDRTGSLMLRVRKF